MEKEPRELASAKLTAQMTEALLALVLEQTGPVTVTTAQIGQAVKQGRKVEFRLQNQPGVLQLYAEGV